ncbi:hypothetical protein SNEBB_006962 [Seison nebaliae]|nr:hypothetical protein SNEBB_006962 [Seison nebaliae]
MQLWKFRFVYLFLIWRLIHISLGQYNPLCSWTGRSTRQQNFNINVNLQMVGRDRFFIDSTMPFDDSHWIGIGFTSNGEFINSDLYVVHKNGSNNLILCDMYSSPDGYLTLDLQQSISGNGSLNGNQIHLSLERLVDTHDTQDVPLTNCAYVIWATGVMLGEYLGPYIDYGISKTKLCPQQCRSGVIQPPTFLPTIPTPPPTIIPALCDPNFCQNNGICVGRNRCRCQTGFVGNRCQFPVG